MPAPCLNCCKCLLQGARWLNEPVVLPQPLPLGSFTSQGVGNDGRPCSLCAKSYLKCLPKVVTPLTSALRLLPQARAPHKHFVHSNKARKPFFDLKLISHDNPTRLPGYIQTFSPSVSLSDSFKHSKPSWPFLIFVKPDPSSLL